VQVTPPDGNGNAVSLGSLPPGSVSDWVSVDTAQRYPTITATSLGSELVHLPYQGTAQPPLVEGRYTYALRLEAGRMAVDLEREET
jgi:hypothetical protein